MTTTYVTTSWDDGHRLDEKLSHLLDRYGLKGTFYISRDYLLTERLSEAAITAISKKHEIGAHTLTHRDLTKLGPENAAYEMSQSKRWLEDLLGKQVLMFCYPRGIYNQSVVQLVRKAGFRGARTTRTFAIEKVKDPFQLPTSIHAYPFPFRRKTGGGFLWGQVLQPFYRAYPRIRELGLPLNALAGWRRLAKSVFDTALRKGRVFHLWGHSWEIENHDMWDELEDVFRYIAGRESCRYVTNYELLRAF